MCAVTKKKHTNVQFLKLISTVRGRNEYKKEEANITEWFLEKCKERVPKFICDA